MYYDNHGGYHHRGEADRDRCMNIDQGPAPYTADIWEMAVKNNNFRTTIWTGCHLQMTLMSIPVCGDVGTEIHEDTDQMLRVEQGNALVKMKRNEDRSEYMKKLSQGDGIFVPAGTKHNIINIGNIPLKLSSVYAPPHHPRGTIHHTKADAENEM